MFSPCHSSPPPTHVAPNTPNARPLRHPLDIPVGADCTISAATHSCCTTRQRLQCKTFALVKSWEEHPPPPPPPATRHRQRHHGCWRAHPCHQIVSTGWCHRYRSTSTPRATSARIAPVAMASCCIVLFGGGINALVLQLKQLCLAILRVIVSSVLRLGHSGAPGNCRGRQAWPRTALPQRQPAAAAASLADTVLLGLRHAAAAPQLAA